MNMNTHYQYIHPQVYESSHSGPHLLIIAGIHGDEYEPIHAVERLIDEMEKASFLKRGKLTLVPVVNEPAHQLDARCGPDNKDLARTCPGNPEGSITEKIAAEISDLIRTSDYLIDMHTGGKRFEIYPLSGYMLHSNALILEKQRKMSQVFGLPVQWGTSPLLEGRTLSVARDAGIPAIYTEYGGGGPSQPEIVEALYKGCMNVLTDLDMIQVRSGTAKTPIYTVEDHRPESGHLQILYPSPVSGPINYLISLGEKVQKGQSVARIRQNDEKDEITIVSQDEGIVFLINRQPEIEEQVSTLGILPIIQPGKITLI